MLRIQVITHERKRRLKLRVELDFLHLHGPEVEEDEALGDRELGQAEETHLVATLNRHQPELKVNWFISFKHTTEAKNIFRSTLNYESYLLSNFSWFAVKRTCGILSMTKGSPLA